MLRSNLTLVTLLIGTVLVPINSTMISVALEPMSKAMHVQISDISWLVTVYLLVMAIAQPLSGKLSDIWGRKKSFIVGTVLFLVASVGCITAAILPLLILFRGLQAVAGAIMTPASIALIRVNYLNKQLSRALGITSLTMGLGASVGPLIGSSLLSIAGWRWLFGINLPFILLCMVLAMVLLKESRGDKAPVDLAGSGLLLASLLDGVLMLTEKLPVTWYGVLAWIGITLLFLMHQSKVRHPLIQFHFFRSAHFTVANLSIFLSNFAMYATILVMPILLKEQYSLSLENVGFLMLIFSLSMSITSWAESFVALRVGGTLSIGIGFAAGIVSSSLYLLCLSFWKLHSEMTLIGLFIIGGLAAGIGIVAMQTMSLEAVRKKDAGSASGIFSTFRYMGSILSSVAIAAFYHKASIVFIFMLASSVIGLLLILLTIRKRTFANFSSADTISPGG